MDDHPAVAPLSALCQAARASSVANRLEEAQWRFACLPARRFRAARSCRLPCAAAAATAIDGVARPALSFAADRPRVSHGLQSGDVSVDFGVVWARADRPARMLVEVATTESFKQIRHAAYVDVLPESDFTGKLLLEDLPAGQDIFYRVRFQNLSSPAIVGEPQVGRFRTAPARSQERVVHLVGRHRRLRLGHRPRARRHAHLRDHAGEPPRLLHSLRRHHLRRLPDRRAAQAAERRGVAQRGHRGEIQGRRDARRVPRQLQIQSHRREPARVQRRGADLRAVGRSRGHRRLDSRRQPSATATAIARRACSI